MAPKLNLFYTLKLGPPSKKSDNFSQHWLGIDGTMIVALYLKSVDWRNDRAAVCVSVLLAARSAFAFASLSPFAVSHSVSECRSNLNMIF